MFIFILEFITDTQYNYLFCLMLEEEMLLGWNILHWGACQQKRKDPLWSPCSSSSIPSPHHFQNIVDQNSYSQALSSKSYLQVTQMLNDQWIERTSGKQCVPCLSYLGFIAHACQLNHSCIQVVFCILDLAHDRMAVVQWTENQGRTLLDKIGSQSSVFLLQ